jgi:hypothetical protein
MSAVQVSEQPPAGSALLADLRVRDLPAFEAVNVMDGRIAHKGAIAISDGWLGLCSA